MADGVMTALLEATAAGDSTPFSRLVDDWRSPCGHADNGAALNTFARTGRFAAHLRAILSTPAAARQLCLNSYRHANGFTKLLIARSQGDQFRLRLHFWPASQWADQNIHDHRFDFWSAILHGGLINQVWREADDDPVSQPYALYRYRPRETRSAYDIERMGQASLTIVDTFRSQAGEAYYLDNTDLHTISCEGAAVTLLLEDRRRIRPFANVYSRRHERAVEHVESPSLSMDAYASFLERALSLLDH